jgi:hypothetical protein
MTHLQGMVEKGDFVQLESADEYAAYLQHLSRVFRFLIEWYKKMIDGGNTEQRLLTGFLGRMMFTVEMLRLKHLYSPSYNLELDLNESGFPHSLAIMELETDLRLKQEKLLTLQPRGALLQQLLDGMFRDKKVDDEALWLMADREYYSSIDANKLLLAFTPGELQLTDDEPTCRKYFFSWACYDFSTNMPYIHLLAFDQDKSEESLEARGTAYHHFVEVIKAEGSRVPTVGMLASQIDEALRAIHPKVLKRVCIGPILCPRFSRDVEPEPMLELLKQFGGPNDFALRLMSEIVISKYQVSKPGGLLSFGRAKRIKEVFQISESDLRCYEHKATVIHDHLLYPHKVRQQVIDDPRFAQYVNCEQIVYTNEGEIHVVD